MSKTATIEQAINSDIAVNGAEPMSAPISGSMITNRIEALQKEMDQLSREERALEERLPLVRTGIERLTGAIFENQRMLQTLQQE